MSLLPECYRWSEQALLALDDTKRGTVAEMRLEAGLGYSLMYTRGGDGARAALDRGLALAEDCGEVLYQMWLLGALNILYFRNGNCRMALQCAERNSAVAKAIGDPAAFASAHFMLANSLYLVGDLGGVRIEFEATLQNRSHVQRTGRTYFAFDIVAPARLGLAHTLCQQGYPRQAAEQAHLMLKDALHIEHPATLSILLTRAFLLFLWIGDLKTVEMVIDRYISNARSHSMEPHAVVGRGLKAVLAIRRGDPQNAVDILQGCMRELPMAGYGLMAAPFNLSLAEGFAATGRFAEGIRVIDDGMRQVETNGDFIYMPELLRVKGALLLSMPQPRVEEAEMNFIQSLELSRQQGARACELRATMSMARLWRDQGNQQAAYDFLAPIYGWFTEGFDTLDLKEAKALLDELHA
jgi:hypothetical protein